MPSLGPGPAFPLTWRWDGHPPRRTGYRPTPYRPPGRGHRGHACRGFSGGRQSLQRQTGLRCGRWGRPTREEPVEYGGSGFRRALHNSHLANRHKYTLWIPSRGLWRS
jgi:hypothetical protein